MILNKLVTYAQNREDILLDAFFDDEEVGFYVDVGAEAPTELSVTKLFYEKGWHGINIEPIARQHQLFVKERPRDINLNIGIAEKTGELKFREYKGSGYSTFSQETIEEHLNDNEALVKEYEDYTAKVMTLKDVFKEQDVTSIQFMKVDVEGLEYDVLAGNDWSKYRPEVICIEANHINKDWHDVLKKNAYEFVFFDGLNEYYADTGTDRSQKFDYVKSVVFREPILNFRFLEDYEEYDKSIAWLKRDLDIAREQNQALSSALNDVTPLKRHIVKSVKKQLVGVDRKITTHLAHDASFTATPVESSTYGTLQELLEVAKQNDNTNVATFNVERHDHPLLPAYKSLRQTTHRTARNVLSKVVRK